MRVRIFGPAKASQVELEINAYLARNDDIMKREIVDKVVTVVPCEAGLNPDIIVTLFVEIV